MLIKWKTAKHTAEITRVVCVRETAKTVIVLDGPTVSYCGKPIEQWERAALKWTDYDKYHATWEVAHAHLKGAAEHRINAARNELQRARDFEGNVKGLKPPKETT